MMKTLRVKILMVVYAAAFISACSTVERNSNTPEGAFAIAEEFEKSDRYEEAIRRYNDVKNKFPYSNYATKAEMAVADVYFKQESFAEAQVAYQSFRDLHPKHPQIDYVTYRIAQSYSMQLPSTIDRDLTLASDAITTYTELIQKFPNSQYIEEAKTKRAESLKMLAQKEEYIADFYFKHKNYDSALKRYEGLFGNFTNSGLEAKALSRAVICAKRVGDDEKVKKYSAVLFKNYNDSPEAAAARKEIR